MLQLKCSWYIEKGIKIIKKKQNFLTLKLLADKLCPVVIAKQFEGPLFYTIFLNNANDLYWINTFSVDCYIKLLIEA